MPGTIMGKLQLNSLREVITQKSAQQAATIEALKAEGKSEKLQLNSEKLQLNSLREVIAQKSAQQAATIEALKAEGKSEKSMQCMKVYTDFDILVMDIILGVEGAAEKMVKKLDTRYNKVAWVEIDKKEYIKLLGGDYPEDHLKMEKGKFYKK